MDNLLLEYLPILVFLGIALGLGLVLLLAAAVIAIRNPDPEKVSAYECGFNAFDDARMKFDVSFKDISMIGFWSMIVFFGVLAVGFAYEWKKGALEWE